MRKLLKRIGICAVLVVSIWTVTLIRDRQTLSQELVRMHIVANSDDPADQNVKLLVRDAVIDSLEDALRDVADIEQAKAYLRENLPKIRQVAGDALEAAGCDREAAVSFCRESFDIRRYETFTLPAGVYDSLRITIGEGKGHNWWCVAYPSLCEPATVQEFRDVAAGAGFSGPLQEALTGEEPYELRFFFLDLLGRIQNRFLGDN